MKMAKAIIFDLWNTLACKKFSISGALKEHFGIRDKDYFEKYTKLIQTKNWNSIEEMAKEFLEHFNLSVLESNIMFVVKTFEDGIQSAELHEGVEELLAKLKETHKIAVLSNTNPFEVINEKWNIKQHLSEEIYSFQISHLKPSNESFNIILEKLNVKPEECIFIDDNSENLLAAKKLGMKIFRSVNEWKKSRKNLV